MLSEHDSLCLVWYVICYVNWFPFFKYADSGGFYNVAGGKEDVEKFLVSLQVPCKDEVQVALPIEPTLTTYDNIVGSLPNHVRDINSVSSFPTILTEFAQSI